MEDDAMSNIFNNRINKIVTYILLINIIGITVYNIGGAIALKWDLVFRGWIYILYMINIFFFIATGIVIVNIFRRSKIYSKVSKIISTVITGIVVFIGCWYVLLTFVFTYSPEHIVYEENQKVIAKVVPFGFHHTRVDFYEPVNIFLMRRSNIPSKTYDGSYDMYEN